MWRLWTKGWYFSGWWYWFKEQVPMQLAWWLPKKVAYWAFIRVYAKSGNGPGPEFKQICDEWNRC